MASRSDSSQSSFEAGVLVILDANRSKISVDALDWALKNIVRKKDTVVVLAVLSEIGKKSSTSCFPFHMGIGVKLEFSVQGDMSPRDLEEEIEKKREEYHCMLQPFYRQCKKNEVKLEVKLAAGYDPRKLTVEEAHKFGSRWIVLDSNLKKHKVYIYGHVPGDVAVMKGKGVATLMPLKAPTSEQWPTESRKSDNKTSTGTEPEQHQDESTDSPLETNLSHVPPSTPRSPCWYPLSRRTGFPRAFIHSELELITNGFADENLVCEQDFCKTYEGIYHETPVLISVFSGHDAHFWSHFKILSEVRHRSILNLVGYCRTDASLFLLCDYPCSGSLGMNLLCDELAKNLSWLARWAIALDIGAALRYLHEDCVDGPIVHLCVCSTHVALCHGSSALLCMIYTAKWLKDDNPGAEDSRTEEQKMEEDELLQADVHAYGVLLVELISGKSSEHFPEQNEGLSLIDWAMPLLENGSLNQLMDTRLNEAKDIGVVQQMAHAALLCLKESSGQKYSISKALAAVRGDPFSSKPYY